MRMNFFCRKEKKRHDRHKIDSPQKINSEKATTYKTRQDHDAH